MVEALKQLDNPIVLILCPKSIIHQWSELTQSISTTNIHIHTYEWLLTKQCQIPDNLTVIVLDEASKIRNPKTKLCQRVLALPQTKYRWILTATPIENRLRDVVPLLEFVGETDLFNETYNTMKSVYNISRHRYNNIDAEKVSFALSRSMIRRKKELDIPLETKMIWCKLEAESRYIYNWFLTEDYDTDYQNLLGVITRLRQVCNSPQMISKKFEHGRKFNTTSRLIKKILAEDQSNAIILFSEYLELLKLFQEQFPDSLLLHGKLTTLQRKQLQEQFQAGKKRLLLMTKAGEYGLNLQQANYVIHYDLSWNPARNYQRLSRAYRLKQMRPVTEILVCVTDSIEERILEVIGSKKEIYSTFVDTNAKRVRLTKDFLLEVLAQEKLVLIR